MEDPKRCLVIQLGSLSQQLQSLMALRAIKQLYPQLELTIVVAEDAAVAVDRIPWIESVVRISVPISPDSLSVLNARPWDWIVNWTFSEASSHLTAQIPARNKLGYGRGRDGTMQCHDDWSMYVLGIVQQQVPQDIHVTDIMTTQFLTALQFQLGEPVEDVASSPVTSRAFFQLKTTDDGFDWDWQHSSLKWVCLPFDRRFLTFGSDMVVELLERHPDFNIVMCGTESQVADAAAFENKLRDRLPRGNKFSNRVGKTTFDQWAHILSRCQWVISYPGAAVQLASVLGTRVLMVTGEDLTLDGPYGNGHYVVPENAVVSTWSYASTEWSHQRKRPFDVAALGTGKAYRSRIRPPQEGGGVYFEPLSRGALTATEWSARVLGQVARTWYCGWTSPAGNELENHHVSAELLRELRGYSECLDVLEKISNQAVLACSQISDKSQRLHSEKVMRLQDREAISKIAASLKELDQLMDRMTEIREPFKVFTYMRKVMMHELRGNGLTELGRQSAMAYQRIAEAVRLYKDWIQATLDRGKPRMVHIRTSSPAPNLSKEKDIPPN